MTAQPVRIISIGDELLEGRTSDTNSTRIQRALGRHAVTVQDIMVVPDREDAIVISDIPLLIEVGWQKDVDLVLLVYLPPDEQVRRIMTRNGLSREEALDRVRSQMPMDEKIPYAHIVIDNSGDLNHTRQEIDRLWPELLEMEKTGRRKND